MAPLQEVYAGEVEGHGQDFHLKAVQISIVLKLSCCTSPGQTIEGQQGHPCTHPNLQHMVHERFRGLTVVALSQAGEACP